MKCCKSNQCYFGRHEECWMSGLCDCECHDETNSVVLMIIVVASVECPVCRAKPADVCSYANRWGKRTNLRHPHQARVEAFELQQHP